MKGQQKIAAIILLIITGAGTITLAGFFNSWVLMSAKMEEEEQFRRLDFSINQLINESKDELRILFPLLSGNASRENIRSAYKQWETLTEYKTLVNSIIFVKSIKDKEITAYSPASDSYQADFEDASLSLLLNPESRSFDKYIEYMNKLYNEGYIIMPVFSGNRNSDVSVKPDQVFIVTVNQDVMFGKLLKQKIEEYMPGHGYRIHRSDNDRVIVENTFNDSSSPDIIISLRGNLFQFGDIPQYNWEMRESRRFPKDSIRVMFGSRLISAEHMVHGERTILIDFFLAEDTYFRQIRIKKVLSMIFGNSALFLIWGSLLVLTLLYGRSRALRKQEQEFVSSVSHELRTPLAVILAASDNLSAGIISRNKKVNTYGNEINNQAQRLSRMVEGVLLYAKMGRKTLFQYNPVLINTNQTINEILRPLTEIIRPSGAELKITVNLPKQIKADPSALAVILENLIMNAFYHGKPKKPEIHIIEVSARIEDNRSLVIIVKDNGPGLRKKERKNIFRPFYRSRSSIENQHPGSGIGLYILAKVCRSSNGRAEIRNRSDGISGVEAEIIIPVEVPDGKQKNPDY